MKMVIYDQGDTMDDKKERLFKVAKELFFEFGYKKTSVNDITSKAGVAKGTFYIYFKSKADVFALIWSKTLEKEIQRFISSVSGMKDSKEKLRAFISGAFNITQNEESYAGKIISRRNDFLYAMEEITQHVPQTIISEKKFLNDMIINILKDGIDSGEFRVLDIEKTGGVIHSMMFLISFLDKIELITSMNRNEFIDTLTELLLAGIKKYRRTKK